MHRGLAESTHRTYSSGLKRFLAFCHACAISTPFPVTEYQLCSFVATLARQGLAPSTIRTYVAAVRHAQIVRGLPEPREHSALPRLHLVQSGVRRDRAERGLPASRPRLPITPPILRQMHSAWTSGRDSLMLWAASLTCFFGFFRAGEITVPAASAFDPAVHLAWGDVTCDGRPASCVRVFLKRSKTDQFHRGVAVYLGATGNDLCPVAAVLAYVAVRGEDPGPFFRFGDGTPLTKVRFVTGVRDALRRAGISDVRYSGHSFRIGAATTAAAAGIQDSTIQTLGRWSSAAFLTYIRTPRSRLAQFSRSLAGASRA